MHLENLVRAEDRGIEVGVNYARRRSVNGIADTRFILCLISSELLTPNWHNGYK